MFKQIVRRTAAIQKSNQQMSMMLVGGSQRMFSAASAEYETIKQESFYTPQREVQFTNNQSTIFNSEDSKENKYVAWEVKEATIKNSLGLLGVNMFNVLFPMGPGYAFGQIFFCLNYVKTVFNLMSNSVTKMDLSSDGKSVILKFGKFMDKEVTVPINQIKK